MQYGRVDLKCRFFRLNVLWRAVLKSNVAIFFVLQHEIIMPVGEYSPLKEVCLY